MWTLIVIAQLYAGASVSFKDFRSLDACKSAQVFVMQYQAQGITGAKCVRK